MRSNGSSSGVGEDLPEGEARLRLLADCGLLLARYPNQPAALMEVAARVVPLLADAAFIDLLNENGEIVRVAWAHKDQATQAQFDALWPTVAPTNFSKHPMAVRLAEGDSVYEAEVTDDWLQRAAFTPSHLAFLRSLRICSAITIPFHGDGIPFGAVTLYRCDDASSLYTESDLRLASEIGRRIGIAVAHARQNEALRRLNKSLETLVTERTRERDRIWLVSDELMSVAARDGYLKSVNPAWTKTLGLDEAALLATPFREFGHPLDQSAVEEAQARIARGEAVVRYESRMRRADGSYRWISWTVVPEGDLFYAIGRDVTDQHAAADELAATNRQLRNEIEERERVEEALRQMQRLEAIGQLTSGVAHDFNNLLTVLLGNIAILERQLATSADPKLSQRLTNMRIAGERGAQLTAQLLAFSRRQHLEPKPLDLNKTLAATRDLLQTTLGSRIRIELRLAPELVLALVDPNQVELVLLNLAINARDAMNGEGSIIIRTENVELGSPLRNEDPAPGKYVEVAIEDAGPGMTEDVMAKAFEPFFTTKGLGKGSGLGLSQVLGFAKQSGGGVRLESELGRGTKVRIFLPRAAEGEISAEKPNLTDSAGREGARILLVDDDAPVRDVIATRLRDLGYEVAEAGSGGAALDILDGDEAIDVALLDFAMPGMNGVELAKQIGVRRPSLPILFVTGYAETNALSDIGEDRIILKPPMDEDLSRKLNAATYAARARSSP